MGKKGTVKTISKKVWVIKKCQGKKEQEKSYW